MNNETPLFTSEFQAMFMADEPDYAAIRRHVINEFNRLNESDVPIDSSPVDEKLIPVVQWVNQQLMFGDATFFTKQPRLKSQYHTCLSEKTGFVGQYHCPFCRDGFLISVIPIRIKPQSHQSASTEIKNAFKKAIAHRFKDADFNEFKDATLCIMVTFVISEQRQREDVDNLPKLLLDALHGYIFENDRQIDHLNSIQTRWPGEEEWIQINVRKSDFNSRDDVLYRGMNHNWAGAEPLELEDFMDTTKSGTKQVV